VTLDPPTKLPNDLHREAKTNTDDTFEEKAKKATQENTATIDPPTKLSTDPHRGKYCYRNCYKFYLPDF
jgi:hypothetical protein